MDELVKRLRAYAGLEWHFRHINKQAYEMIKEAADAIEELMRRCEQFQYMPPPAWIPVTERLPDGRDSVLALTGDCDIYVCDYIPSVKQFWTIPGDELHIDDITHWMPLPEPPEEE